MHLVGIQKIQKKNKILYHVSAAVIRKLNPTMKMLIATTATV